MSSTPEPRITISEERVKNLLYEMKDQLLEALESKFEKKADLFMLNEVRRQQDADDLRIVALEKWQWRLAGAATLAILLAGAAITIAAALIQ